MTYNCAFANCIHNTNNSKGCTYTNFPRDEARRRQWIQISGNKDLVNKTLQQLNKCHVCNCHFNTHEYKVKDKRFILNSLSILPTVKTPDKPLSDDDMVPKQPVIHPRLETIAVVKKIQPNLIRTVVNRNANSRTSGNELKKNPMKILGNQEKVLQPLSINNSSTVKELTPKSSMVTEQDNFVVLEQAAEGNSTPSQPEDTMAIEAINAPRTMDVPSLDQIISMGSLSIDQSVTSNETAITGQIDDHLTNLVVPTNISTTPDTRSSSPDKDISSLPSGSERRRKKKKSNLHLLLPPFNDPDSSIIPNRDVREANRTEIDDHPTGSMVPMDTLTIPDTRTSTPDRMTNKRKMSHSPEKENLGIIKRPRKSVGNARKNLQVSFCKDVITESESGEKNNNSESDQLTDSTVPVNNSITSNRASQAGKRRRESMICESNGFSYDQSYKSSPKKTLLFNVMMKNDKTIQDLKKDIEEKNKKIEMLENESEKCQGVCQVESPLLRQLVDAHLRNKDVKQPQGRRWTFQDKMLSLNVLKRGVAAYKFLHAQDPTSFPSERTAQRFFNQLTMNIGLDDDYLEALAKKLSTMDPKARLFTLGADEYSIQPIPVFDMYTDRIVGYQNYGKDMPHLNSPDIANKCLVFMLQGLYTNIAQPLAFYFNRGGIKGSDLTELTLKIIRKLKSKGIIVKAFVTDQAKPNCLAMDTLRGYGPKTKCVCPAATAIPKRMCMCRQKTHFISDGVTIYVIPDAPHEWKCVKNNWNGDWDTWMKENKKNYKNDDKLKSAYPGCTLSIDGIVGAWKDLVLLYDIKKSEGDTIWNDQMMFPGSRDKMRVKLTTRLASLKTYAELKSSQFIKAKKTRDEKDGQKNQDSNNQDTALVIWLLNAICDITNGPSKSDKKSCPERCLVTKNSYHWEGWKKFMKMLENTHFIKMDKTTTVPPSISNLRLTMSAMSDLCDELLNQHGFESVNLRRMHQDVIENFFSLLRSALDANSTPSAIETMRLVKCLIISKFSSPSTRDSNCEKDDSEFLLNQKDWFELSKKSKEKVSKLQANCTNNNVSIVVNDDNNDPVFHIPDYDSDCGDIVELIFVSNDFLPRLVTREMMKHLNVNNCEECKSCFIKNTGDEYCWEPTDKFVKLITDCHKIFEDKIAPEPNMENIANTTITEFDRGITRIDWLCTRHEENIKILLLPKLARIFISRLISMSVRKFKTFASRVNNVAKINQQTLFDNEAPDDKYIPQIKKRKLKHQAPADC